MHAVDRIGIIGPGFLGFLGGVFVVMVVTTVLVGRHHHWFLPAGALLTLLVAVTTVAAGFNAYYAYLPNLGSLWGWRAADQAEWDAVRVTGSAKLNSGWRMPARGAVVEVRIPGPTSQFHARPAEIYLPPAWFQRPRPPLPVVELLHGTPGTPMDWTRSAGVDVTSDQYAATHNGIAPILVMPDVNGSFMADSECTDGTMGNVETYLTVDVPKWVRTNLHPSRQPRRWAIGGLSEGGTCAIDIALRHPSEFPTFLDFGGDKHITRHGGAITLFRGSLRQRFDDVLSYDPVALLDGFPAPGQIAGWFEVGSRDNGTTTAVEQLYQLAVRRGVHAKLWLSQGGHHSFRVWKLGYQHALPWLGQRLLIGGADRGPSEAQGPGIPTLLAQRGAVGGGVAAGARTRR